MQELTQTNTNIPLVCVHCIDSGTIVWTVFCLFRFRQSDFWKPTKLYEGCSGRLC
jgi:hypothetical protein